MPHNPDFQPKPHAFARRYGQIPLTKFRNYADAIDVELIQHTPLNQMLDGVYDFIKATWSNDGFEAIRATNSEKKEALMQMLSGKALPLGLETVQFIFRISGISRIDTHQIVRQRIGVTFSQQCSGDQFWNHQNALVEPSIHKKEFMRREYIWHTLEAKRLYAKMVSNGVSIQAARSILPHNLETFLFMRCDLATLLMFYKKRIDYGSQTWQLNEIANQMAGEVMDAYGAWMAEPFTKAGKQFTFQKDAGKDRKNTFSTSLYLPDPDDFDYHEHDFLYPKKKYEMLELDYEFEPFYYWGDREIDREQYNEISDLYANLDKISQDSTIRAEELMKKANEVNAQIVSSVLYGGENDSRS